MFNLVTISALAKHSTHEWTMPDLLSSAVFRPSASLGYEFIPNSNFQSGRAHRGINSFGMYDRERTQEKHGGAFRIIVLGDSTTACSEYTHILEDSLNKEGSGKVFEVWNCAVPGYSVLQYCRALEEKWLKYNPDMVLFGFTINDFDSTPLIVKESDHLMGYFPHKEIMPGINPFLLKHSALYQFIVFRGLFLKNEDDRKDIHNIAEADLKKIKDLLSARGIDFMIVIVGLPANLGEYPHWKKNYESIRNIIGTYDIRSLDIVPVFENYGPEKLNSGSDELHFNEKGARIIADEIYGYLASSEIL